jgi:hypothetical protein
MVNRDEFLMNWFKIKKFSFPYFRSKDLNFFEYIFAQFHTHPFNV